MKHGHRDDPHSDPVNAVVKRDQDSQYHADGGASAFDGTPSDKWRLKPASISAIADINNVLATSIDRMSGTTPRPANSNSAATARLFAIVHCLMPLTLLPARDDSTSNMTADKAVVTNRRLKALNIEKWGKDGKWPSRRFSR
jgi:hypothetical protein